MFLCTKESVYQLRLKSFCEIGLMQSATKKQTNKQKQLNCFLGTYFTLKENKEIAFKRLL